MDRENAFEWERMARRRPVKYLVEGCETCRGIAPAFFDLPGMFLGGIGHCRCGLVWWRVSEFAADRIPFQPVLVLGLAESAPKHIRNLVWTLVERTLETESQLVKPSTT